MVLRAGYMALAFQLQEAAEDLSSNDLRARLSDAINDQHRGTGTFAYYIDHFGDADTGHVIYSCDGETMSAPYTISGTAKSTKCDIDFEAALDVVPRTVYEIEDESMIAEEALRESVVHADDGWYLMSQDGKKKLGGPYKKRGQAVAREKQVTYFKKAKESRQGGESDQKEARKSTSEQPGQIKLIESAAFTQDIQLREAFEPGRKIKLISPGAGSTAYYTAEVLKRDGPKVFKAGTPMRIDHPTRAQEKERPEGSVKDWGAVLRTPAEWLESYITPSGKDSGPGLYSDIKTFSDHSQTIDEKGPFAGVSICAWGDQLVENGKTVMRDGVPVLARLTAADGVDMVTRAGAGGMFLTEAARAANPTEGGVADMDQAEVTKLIESAVKAAQAPLLERALRGDAREEAARLLRDVTLPEASKQRVIESVLREIPKKDGALDTAKFAEAITAAAKDEGQYVAALTGSGKVRGMGAAPAPQVSVQEAEQIKESKTRNRERSIKAYEALGMPRKAAEAAVSRGEVAA